MLEWLLFKHCLKTMTISPLEARHQHGYWLALIENTDRHHFSELKLPAYRVEFHMRACFLESTRCHHSILNFESRDFTGRVRTNIRSLGMLVCSAGCFALQLCFVFLWERKDPKKLCFLNCFIIHCEVG